MGKLWIGAHLTGQKSLLDGLKNIKKMNGNAISLFTASPQKLGLDEIKKLTNEEVKEYINYSEKEDIITFIHAPYILNLARDLIPKNKIFLIRTVKDLEFNSLIKSKGVVVHFGTYGDNTIEKAEDNMAKSINNILQHSPKNSTLILETSSGEGKLIGKTLESMKNIYKKIKNKSRIKFCIDTCHIFVAGYDIRKEGAFNEYIKHFEKLFGKNKIALIHLNDSKTPFDGKNDRHAELGKGYIFDEKLGGNMNTLKEIVMVSYEKEIPMILETHCYDYSNEIKLVQKLFEQKGGKLREELIKEFSQLRDFHKALGNIYQYQSYKNLVNKLSKIDNINNLKDIEGVGKGILEKIQEYKETGKIKVLEDMKKDKKLNALVELQYVFGIGPNVTKKMIDQGIYSINNLREKVKRGEIKLTEGQEVGLKYLEDLRTPILRKDAEKYIKDLRKITGQNIILSGGFRLGKQQGKDLDLIIEGDNNMEEVEKKLDKYVVKKLERGDNKLMLLMRFPGENIVRHVDIFFVNKEDIPFFLLYFGSGENFSRKIRKIAKNKGFKLNEKGLFKNDKKIDLKSEEEIFNYLNLPYVKPENRL